MPQLFFSRLCIGIITPAARIFNISIFRTSRLYLFFLIIMPQCRSGYYCIISISTILTLIGCNLVMRTVCFLCYFPIIVLMVFLSGIYAIFIKAILTLINSTWVTTTLYSAYCKLMFSITGRMLFTIHFRCNRIFVLIFIRRFIRSMKTEII